jgi:hypothetical protein
MQDAACPFIHVLLYPLWLALLGSVGAGERLIMTRDERRGARRVCTDRMIPYALS